MHNPHQLKKLTRDQKRANLEKQFVIRKNGKGWYVWDSKNGVILDGRHFYHRESAENYRIREIHLCQ